MAPLWCPPPAPARRSAPRCPARAGTPPPARPPPARATPAQGLARAAPPLQDLIAERVGGFDALALDLTAKLVHQRLAVEAEHLGVGAQEPLGVGRARQHVPLFVLERAQVLDP